MTGAVPAAVARPGPRPARRRARAARPRLIGLGTAVPSLEVPQCEIAEQIERLLDLPGPQRLRWRRIVAGGGIDSRRGVVPMAAVLELTTQQRMSLYEQHAPGLAAAAAIDALRQGGVSPHAVTDLIIVSCTGFSAPGLDVELTVRLGLSPTVRRTTIGFMGCYGAIAGLRCAEAAAAANADSVVLVCCVELCSLHLRPDRDPENLVASALFADGAAAALVAGGRATPRVPALARLTPGACRLIPDGREWMSWRITDQGFAMTLSRAVPSALRSAVGAIVEQAEPRPSCFVVHPGGPGILDAVDAGLGLGGGRGLEAAREVLRRHGNMSSPTVLFVLAEALRRGYRPPAMLLAFGPGLTIESMVLE